MIAYYEETYASLAQSLLDGIAKDRPSSKHIMNILMTLKQEADSDAHPMTSSIFSTTKIGNKLFETVKACRKQISSAEDGASKDEWSSVMKFAEELLERFRDADIAEGERSATASSMPKSSARLEIEKKISGDVAKIQAHEPSAVSAGSASACARNADDQTSSSASMSINEGLVFCASASQMLSNYIARPDPPSTLILDTLSNLDKAIHKKGNHPMTMEMIQSTKIGNALAHTIRKCKEMKLKLVAISGNVMAKEEYDNWDRANNIAGDMLDEFNLIAKKADETKKKSALASMTEKKLARQIELQKLGGIPAGRRKTAYEPTSSSDDFGWDQHNSKGMGQETTDHHAGQKPSSSSLSSVKKKSAKKKVAYGKLKQPPKPTATSKVDAVGNDATKPSIVPWECTKCSHTNTKNKSKCESCKCWKGGKRTPSKSAPKESKKVDPSPTEIIVIDDVGEQDSPVCQGGGRPKRKLKSVARFADTQSLRDNSHLHPSHKIADGFACPNCAAINSYESTECHICTLNCYYEAGVGVVTLKERNEFSCSPMKKRQKRGKSKVGDIEANLPDNNRKTPPEKINESLAKKIAAAKLGWERKRKSQDVSSEKQGEQQPPSTIGSIGEKADKLAREARHETSAIVADGDIKDDHKGSKRKKKAKHAITTVAPVGQSEHERRREAAIKAWATRKKKLAPKSAIINEVQLEEDDRNQLPEKLSPKKQRRTSIIGPVEYAKKMKPSPKKATTKGTRDEEGNKQEAQVAEADGIMEAAECDDSISIVEQNDSSKTGEDEDHDITSYCQRTSPAKFNGFSEDTLPQPNYKRAQRVYAKDDSTGLLYPAMVRKVLWGPKSDRNSMGCVSAIVDGKPNNGAKNDIPQAGDDEEEDEGSRRWNPKYNCWHYYVHYMGWAIRWDRWAEERFIYEDSSSSEALAKTLMTEYNKLKPKKRNQKMSLSQVEVWMKRMVQIEEEHNKAISDHAYEVEHGELHSEHFRANNTELDTTKEEVSDSATDVAMDDAQETETKETSDKAKPKPAKKLGVETLQMQAKLRESGLQMKRKKTISDRLLLPFNLKKVLVEEWEVITQCDSVHNLPAKVTVRDALNHYLESKLAPLRKKAMESGDEDNDKHAALGKEWTDMVEGIALFFDQALRPHLLYAEERSQYNCLRRQIINQRRTSMESAEEMKEAQLQSKEIEEMGGKASGLLADSKPPMLLPGRMSEIYGCEFLLRLFVRLPGVVAESPTISETQSRRIFSKLGDLMRYLQKHQGDLICSTFRRPLPNEIRAKKLSGN